MPLEIIYKLTPPASTSSAEHEHDHSTRVEDADASRVPSSSAASVSRPYVWSAWSICESLAHKKGFFNRKGDADVYRAANYILREVLDGVITLFFTPPEENGQKRTSER
jgi:hypothetical protein